MNTKGIKFLAVLAVLAMAFAAFAVVSTETQQNDAGAVVTPTYISPSGTAKDTGTVTGTDNTLSDADMLMYYAADDVTIAGVSTAKDYTVFVNSGKTVTITAVGSGSLTIIPVTLSGEKLTKISDVSFTYVAGTASAKFTNTNVGVVDLGTTGTGVIKAANVPAGVTLKIAGTALLKVGNEGVLTNNGSISLTGTDKNLYIDNGGKITSSVSSKGKIVIDHTGTGYGAAITLLSGVFENQDVSIVKTKGEGAGTAFMTIGDVTDRNNPATSRIVLTGDVEVKNNNFAWKGGDKCEWGLNISNPAADSDITIAISNNVFSSEKWIGTGIQVGEGSTEVFDANVKVSIVKNDFSGIDSYEWKEVKPTAVDKGPVRINCNGIVLGASLSTEGVNVETDSKMIAISKDATIKGSFSVDYLGIRAGVKLTVHSSAALTNEGVININGTLAFDKTTNNVTISSVGLLGSGKVIVNNGATLILNQAASGTAKSVLASGENLIKVNTGGKLLVIQTSETDTYWLLVGNSVIFAGEDGPEMTKAAYDADPAAAKFMIAVGVDSYVTLKANLSGGNIVNTDYVFHGAVDLGRSNDVSIYQPGDKRVLINNYFGRTDTVTFDGTIDLYTAFYVKEGVTVNVSENTDIVSTGVDAKWVDRNIDVWGIMNYEWADQVFKNTVFHDSGKIVIKGSQGGSDEKVVFDDTTTDVKAETFSNTDVVISTAAVTNAVIPAGKTLVIENTSGLTTASVLDVSSANSQLSVVLGATTAKSFSVKIAADNVVKLTDVKGTLMFAKGSIIIYGDPWTDGTITLGDGDIAKVSGTLGDVKFDYDGPATGSALILVEKDTKLSITTALTIKSANISMDIEGTVSTTAAGAIKTVDLATDVYVNALPGAEITATVGDVNNDIKFTVFSGSDINGATIAVGLDKVYGKDLTFGTWKFDGTTLTLNNYNGTYNFGADVFATMKNIDLTGDNKVTFVIPEYEGAFAALTMFGLADTAATSLNEITTATSGSLIIELDISNVKKADLATGITVLNSVDAQGLEINGVLISIIVTGTNTDWDSTAIAGMKVTGINTAKKLETSHANVALDIMSDYSTKSVVALNVTDIGIEIADAENVSIKSAGYGIYVIAGDIEFSSSGTIYIEGKKADTNFQPGIRSVGQIELKTVTSVIVKGGMTVGSIKMTGSNMAVAGTAVIAGTISEKNASALSFTGKAEVTGDIDTTQESVLDLKNASIGGVLTNGGVLNVTGNVAVLATGDLINNTVINNSGVIGIYGDFINRGTFNNEGTFEVLKNKFVDADQEISMVPADAATSASNVKFGYFKLGEIEPNADGTAKLTKAVVKFYDKTGVLINEATNEYSGTLTPTVDGGYVLSLKNKADTCTITITYAVKTGEAAGPEFGKSYAISVTGNITVESAVYYLEGNKTGTGASVITDNVLATAIAASGATFATNEDSVIVNNGKFIISANGTPEVAAVINGSFTGDLETNVANVTVKDGFDGNLAANGAGTVTIDEDAEFKGNITTKAAVVVTGELVGNITTEKGVNATGAIIGLITAKDNVAVTDLLGNITVTANGPKNVTVKGSMLGDIIYISKYKETSSATEPTEYTAKMSVLGEATGTGFTVILAAGADATASAAVVPGYFKLDNGMAVLETGKEVKLALTEGKILFDSNVKLKTGYYLEIAAGTTIEVNKSAASLDVKEAALKVSKDATANFETGSGTPVNYGKVLYIMSFTIDDAAFSIYSDVAYALSNCDEGSELTVGDNAPINTNVSIPDGVNIIVDNVILTFNGMDVDMGVGAKITLQGTGKLVFNTSGDNKLIVKEDEEYEYYSVTACIMYGDNELDLMGVRFNADNNVIVGKAATETALAMIDVDLKYNEGTAMVTEGAAIGDLKLANVEYYLTKAAETAGEKMLAAAVFAVAEDAHFELESFTDAKMDAKMTAGEVELLKKPTMLTIAGTLEVCANITVNGTVLGAGSISLDDDKTITLAYGKILDAEKKIYFGPAFTGTIFDDRLNGFEFTAIDAVPEGAAAGATFAITADKTNECITFVGKLYSGSIEAVSDSSVAMLNVVTICDDAVIEASEAIISGANVSNGLFKNVEMTKKTGATLDYSATYVDGAYTVYTIFKNIDLEEISDVTLTKDLNVKDLTEASKVDLSGVDVNITIAEGKKLIVDKILIIGTPITVLGDEGSSIVGKVVIKDGSYLVAYADVDLTFAEILGDDAKTDAVFSKLDVEDMPYAVIFASNQGAAETDIVLAKADAALIPEIVGYNFTAWLNYNGDAKALVGETNAYADAKEVYVTVVVKYVAGVDYYMNGIIFNVYDIPTDVAYGSYFTAKISDTSKYQGNPLINGQKTVCVIDDVELVASGVEPIPEPPQPEPVIGDSGISLTDILLIVLVVLIAIMVVILVLRLNRS